MSKSVADQIAHGYCTKWLVAEATITEQSARIERLESAVLDFVSYIKGDVSGPAQLDAMVENAINLLGGYP